MDTNTIIKQAIEAIKQGNKSNARTLLETVIKNEPNNEEAWFLLAHVAQTQEQARIFLGRVISINPNNERAKQQLEKLNATPSNKQTAPQPVKAKESKAVLYTLLGAIIILLLVVSLLLAGILLKQDSNHSNQSNQSNQSNTTPKWEYMEIMILCKWEYKWGFPNTCEIYPDWSREYTSRADTLRELGQQGWEVIYIIDNPDTNSSGPALTGGFTTIIGLKRPLLEK